MNTSDPRTPILFISHAYYNRGGVETHLKTLTAALAQTHACYILFPQNDNLILVLDGKEIQKIAIAPLSILNPQTNARMEAVLVSALKQIRPALVHVMHFVGWPLSLFETLRASSIPFVCSFHDYYALTPVFTFPEQQADIALTKEYAMQYFGKDISSDLKNRRTFLQGAFDFPKARILPSQYLLDMLAPTFPGEYTIIPYGIPPVAQLLDEQKDSEKIRLGYLGSLIPQKGWQTLLSRPKG